MNTNPAKILIIVGWFCQSPLFGATLDPHGELEVKVTMLEAQIPEGKIVLRCGDDGELQELTVVWNGKKESVARAELRGIALANLQSVKITCPGMPPWIKNFPLKGDIHVVMAFDEPIVTDSLDYASKHVRFNFHEGFYTGRFTAIPDKSGGKWKLFYKEKGEDEEEYKEYKGTLQPWSLIRDFNREVIPSTPQSNHNRPADQ